MSKSETKTNYPPGLKEAQRQIKFTVFYTFGISFFIAAYEDGSNQCFIQTFDDIPQKVDPMEWMRNVLTTLEMNTGKS